MREHLSYKLKELGSKQTSATILSSNIMQETSPELTLLMKYASFLHAVMYQMSTECPAQAKTSKTNPGLQQSGAMKVMMKKDSEYLHRIFSDHETQIHIIYT